MAAEKPTQARLEGPDGDITTPTKTAPAPASTALPAGQSATVAVPKHMMQSASLEQTPTASTADSATTMPRSTTTNPPTTPAAPPPTTPAVPKCPAKPLRTTAPTPLTPPLTPPLPPPLPPPAALLRKRQALQKLTRNQRRRHASWATSKHEDDVASRLRRGSPDAAAPPRKESPSRKRALQTVSAETIDGSDTTAPPVAARTPPRPLEKKKVNAVTPPRHTRKPRAGEDTSTQTPPAKQRRTGSPTPSPSRGSKRRASSPVALAEQSPDTESEAKKLKKEQPAVGEGSPRRSARVAAVSATSA